MKYISQDSLSVHLEAVREGDGVGSGVLVQPLHLLLYLINCVVVFQSLLRRAHLIQNGPVQRAPCEASLWHCSIQ